ncbi:MAG TPA: GNAT family N-acetyltransferase [Chthoniobacterales bacterium]|nr:GNAT family N-acetyltransferase [Chthoniobacterales bacterium]
MSIEPCQPTIRPATEDDAAALLAIYRPCVERRAASFETAVPTLEEFRSRITRSLAGWDWIVAEMEDAVCGYAYGSAHRPRAAYCWSVETSAYVEESYHRRGIGTALYAELFARLTRKGFCNAYAGITLPNDGSVALHRRCGFEPIGVFQRVGYKFGSWHDVAWFQRRLRETPPA